VLMMGEGVVYSFMLEKKVNRSLLRESVCACVHVLDANLDALVSSEFICLADMFASEVEMIR